MGSLEGGDEEGKLGSLEAELQEDCKLGDPEGGARDRGLKTLELTLSLCLSLSRLSIRIARVIKSSREVGSSREASSSLRVSERLQRIYP